jgi:hypothetical protein
VRQAANDSVTSGSMGPAGGHRPVGGRLRSDTWWWRRGGLIFSCGFMSGASTRARGRGKGCCGYEICTFVGPPNTFIG